MEGGVENVLGRLLLVGYGGELSLVTVCLCWTGQAC